MQIRHVVPVLFACLSLIVAGVSSAEQNNRDRGPAASQSGDARDSKAKGQGKEKPKKEHKHANGKNALGEKIRKNGKHEVGKFANRTVTADVNNGKVRSMNAGDLP